MADDILQRSRATFLGLAHKLRQLGFDPGSFDLGLLLQRIRHETQHAKQPLQDVELKRLCHSLA